MNITRFKKRAKTCAICIHEVEFQGKINSCEHVFCFKCIKNWAKIENTCPLCKIRFDRIIKVPHRVFYGELDTQKEVMVVHKKSQAQSIDFDNFQLFIGNAERMIENEFQRLVDVLHSFDLDINALQLEI